MHAGTTEDIPVLSIVIPQEGAISPSHNSSLNKSVLTIQYGICYNFILHCYLSASSLKVFWKFLRLRMQSTGG